jgi:serine/threonine-protein kinase RsbW
LQNAVKPHSDHELLLEFPSDNLSVRQALQQVLRLNLSPDDKSVVEIVLAEVLNNIVEHAYQERPTGRIELAVGLMDDGLDVAVQDSGLPLPDGLPDKQVSPDLDCKTEDLPEGGFGWLLVRELTRDLHYERRDGRNFLSFRIPKTDASQG